MMLETADAAQRVDPEQPACSAEAQAWDEMTVKEWLDARGWTEEAKESYALGVQSVLTSEVAEVSWLYWLFYLKSAGGTERLFDADNGAQERKFVGGSASICERLAAELGSRVVLNAAVQDVEWGDSDSESGSTASSGSSSEDEAPRATARSARRGGGAGAALRRRRASPHPPRGRAAQRSGGARSRSRSASRSLSAPRHTEYMTGVRVRCRDGRTFSADYAVLALAPPMYGKFSFNPPLPGLRQQLTQRTPMGSIIKTVTYYDRAYWREAGYSGSALGDATVGPVIYTYDDTKPDGSKPAIMGFVLAARSRTWMHRSAAERRAAVASQYARAFGIAEMARPSGYAEKNWCAEEFSGGCYVSVMGPRTLTDFAHYIRTPLGPLHFAGTETATKWCGYMDGAVQAGERAAREVAVKLATRSKAVDVAAIPGKDEPANAAVVARPNGPGLLERVLPGPRLVLAVVLLLIAYGLLAFAAERGLLPRLEWAA